MINNLLEKFAIIDQNIKTNYEEINNTIFKGHNKENSITINMFGNYKVDKIILSEEIKKEETETIINSIVEAINDATNHIQEERYNIVKNEINNRMSEN